MLKPITANTPPEAEPHIFAEDDAAIYQSIFGSDGVLNIGSCLKSTVLSNNKVRIADGVACIGGHMCRQPYAEYQDMEIVNGQTGKNRNDIIVAKFVTTGTGGVDTFSLDVVQGAAGTTAADPAITQDNIYEAGKIRELPLYRIKIEGLSIVKVEQLFTVIPTLPEMLEQIKELQAKNSELSSTLLWKDFPVSGNGAFGLFASFEIPASKICIISGKIMPGYSGINGVIAQINAKAARTVYAPLNCYDGCDGEVFINEGENLIKFNISASFATAEAKFLLVIPYI